MIFKTTSQMNVTGNGCDAGFWAEASDLQLGPGHWPTVIEHLEQTFTFSRDLYMQEDFAGKQYLDNTGRSFTIYND